MDAEYLKHQIRDVLGTLLIVIIVSITMLSKGMSATLPLMIPAAFFLFFIRYNIGWIFITTFVAHIVLGAALDSWVSIITWIHNIVQICSGLLLSLCIKRLFDDWKQVRYIVLGVLGMVLVVWAIGNHNQSYGSPKGYLQAKSGVEHYINETYNGELEITGIRYNSKIRSYIVDVMSTKDSRDQGSLFYHRSGSISDDYHFRIVGKQEEDMQTMLKMLINRKTDISMEDMDLKIELTLPHNKYSKRDVYLEDGPVSVYCTIEPRGSGSHYGSPEAFGKEAYKILKILKELDFAYEHIEIQSFLADGNTTYSILMKGPIEVDSWESTMARVEKIEHKK